MGDSLWRRTCSIHDWEHLHGLELKTDRARFFKKKCLKM